MKIADRASKLLIKQIDNIPEKEDSIGSNFGLKPQARPEQADYHVRPVYCTERAPLDIMEPVRILSFEAP